MAKTTQSRTAKRTKWIKLRVSEDDIVVLKRLVDAAGVTISSFMRQQLFGTHPEIVKRAQPMPEIAADLIEALARIGNNLNQIAKKLNSGTGIDVAELTHCLAQLRQLMLSVGS